MNGHDVSLLLAVLGGTCFTAAWLAHRAGDALRDVLFMLGSAGGMFAAALAVQAF